MAKLTIKDLDIKNKKVLMRVDFNVPLTPELKVADDTRIRAAIPTINYVLDREASLILMSHLGRPKGKFVKELSLKPVADELSQLLGREVKMAEDCIGEEVESMVRNLRPQEIILLENLRFHPEEEKNDLEFSKELASLADVYVNDAFGTSHRAHASVVGVTNYLPSAAGFLLEKEINYFEKILHNPPRPFLAILGGAKVSDKIGVVTNLLALSDGILIGGGMAYTFLKAKGIEIGISKLEEDKLEIAGRILEQAKDKLFVLPQDHIITTRIDHSAEVKETEGVEIPEGWIGVDIGKRTRYSFKEHLRKAELIVWNGPLGIFEIDNFSQGSREIAEFIAELNCIKVIGGGDTASAIKKFGLSDKMTHISTGGGASLEYLEGKNLPGIASLKDK
jgi:phosphoglycerate kinase